MSAPAGTPPTLFDVHVVVDWSAAASPTTGRDSIWSAVRCADDPVVVALTNHPTRARALGALVDLIDARPHQRVLVGVDFPLGYPVGFAGVVGADPHDRDGLVTVLAGLVVDDERNRNNRFDVGAELNRRVRAAGLADEGPFWGHPPGRRWADLSPTKPAPHGLSELRTSERVLLRFGLRPFSVWQLAYAGSVGGQALVGIPVVAALAGRFPARVVVWPFDTGVVDDPTGGRDDAVVIAEIWPSGFDVDRGRHPVRDAAQVAHATAETVAADRRGELAAWFHPDVTDRRAVTAEEGWILGVPGDASDAGLPWHR